MNYKEHLNQVRTLPTHELDRRIAALCETPPRGLRPWPVGMPASLDPKIVLIGASPGNSPLAGDSGSADGFSSAPTVTTPPDSHFYYPDGSRYWDKLRYLIHQFCLKEGSVSSELDALSLCSHLNLGTGRAGTADKGVVESAVIGWVSRLLNTTHDPDVVVLFGLSSILRDPDVTGWWNCNGGLGVEWNSPDSQTALTGYRYNFREWTVRNARGHTVRIVTWPNHPSRHPFADMSVWKQSVAQYLGSDDAEHVIPSARASKKPVVVTQNTVDSNGAGWGLTFGSAPGKAAMRINAQLNDVPKTIAEICDGTAVDSWGTMPVSLVRAREHLKWHLDGNSGVHPERRATRTFVRGLMSPSPGQYCLPSSMNPR